MQHAALKSSSVIQSHSKSTPVQHTAFGNAAPSCRHSSSNASCCQPAGPLPSTSHSCDQLSQQRQRVLAQAGFGFGAKSKGSSGSKSSTKDCPCGSGRLYSECCQPMHKSAAAQPDPARLMRARYSAWVKRQPKYLKATSHPDNSALQGSSTTLEDGTVKKCMYEEDVATTMVAIEFTGFEVLGTQLSADGSEAEVDSRATFKRLFDSTGKRVGKPTEEVWMERATLVKDDQGRWLVRKVHQIEPAAAA